MHTVNEIVEEAKRLTAPEQRRLVAEIQKGLASEEANGAEAQRLAALDAWIAKAGTGQSSFTDVARDKYKHLAEVYADRHE
jgi:hypothetical protein